MIYRTKGKLYPSKGFTLIELLIVVAIIGVLLTIVLTSTSEAKKRGRDAKRISDLHQIKIALELYFNDKGYYPPSPCYDGSCWELSTYPGWVTTFQTELAPYIKKLPVDPLNTGTYPWNNGEYVYAYGLVGRYLYPAQYDLVAKFESTNHPLSCGNKNYRYYFNNTELWCGIYSVNMYEASPQNL